jgi:hypothetical protein
MKKRRQGIAVSRNLLWNMRGIGQKLFTVPDKFTVAAKPQFLT